MKNTKPEIFFFREAVLTYRGSNYRNKQINDDRAAAELVLKLIPGGLNAATEHFVVLALDAKRRVLSFIRLSGEHGAVCVTPQVAFSFLLQQGAQGAVLGHNHPSGDTTPSMDDLRLTERLAEAGEIVNVQVLDHVIVGQGGYFSFLGAGLLMKDKALECDESAAKPVE